MNLMLNKSSESYVTHQPLVTDPLRVCRKKPTKMAQESLDNKSEIFYRHKTHTQKPNQRLGRRCTEKLLSVTLVNNYS